MSRMFSVLSGGVTASARPAGPVGPGGRPDPAVALPARVSQARAEAPAPVPLEPATVTADPDFVPDSAETPFVEVGGPAGPVFSHGPAPEPAPAEALPASRATAAPPPARTYPRLAGAPVYLSVRFHDLSGTPRARPSADGPDPGLVAFHYPEHPVSGEYRVLRDEIRAQLPDPTPRVLLFTAAAREAGTTTVLLNLAVTLAREDTPRVLVVDANVPAAGTEAAGSPVADKLALAAGPGLADVLAQQVPLAWAVRPSVVPNLQVLAAGAPSAAVTAVIGEDLPKLIDQLRQWYDWVLIDGGVWGTMPERDQVCPSADAVYLVSREADVDRSEFAGLRGWVKQLGGLLRGYIATRV